MILYPVIMMLSKAFMSRVDLVDNEVILFSKHFTLQNFSVAIKLLDYPVSLMNTVLLTLVSTLLQIFSTILAGYGFARHNFKWKGVLFAIVVFTIIVPPQLVMMPMYMQFKNFDIFGIIRLITGQPANLLNSFFPIWMLSATGVGLKSGLFIFLFRQFFAGLPKELEEAARVDGSGSLRTFLTVMLPNATTVITTVTLFSIVWQYNDVVYSQLFLTSKKVLSMVYVNLERFTDEVMTMLGYTPGDVSMGLYVPLVQSAGTLLILLPLILMFLVAQKYFVQSIERSGIVG